MRDKHSQTDSNLTHELLPNGSLSIVNAYEQAFWMLRKYGDMSIGVRNAVFIQGIVILGGAGYMTLEGKYIFCIVTCLFSAMLTKVLDIMHRHYNAYFISVKKYIGYLETIGMPEHFIGYIRFVEDARDHRVEKVKYGWLKNHGSFALMYLGAFSIALYSFLNIQSVADLFSTLYYSIRWQPPQGG